MSNEVLEFGLPESLRREYLKAPVVRSIDGIFLGRDLAKNNEDNLITAALAAFGVGLAFDIQARLNNEPVPGFSDKIFMAYGVIEVVRRKGILGWKREPNTAQESRK